MNGLHTPGPWSAPRNGLDGAVYANNAAPGTLWRITDRVHGLSDEELAANACLIAAAPELLVAAEALVAYLGRCTNDPLNPCWDNRPTDRIGMHWGKGHACAYCSARGAIAKAMQS